MKYVRTKDGVIFYGPIDKEGRYKCANLGGWKIIKPFWDNIEVINQADTIEELCDEFVCKLKEMPTTWCSFDLDEIEEGLKTHSLKEWEWFGMIWTDKGLTYIAKMNKEGELELL